MLLHPSSEDIDGMQEHFSFIIIIRLSVWQIKPLVLIQQSLYYQKIHRNNAIHNHL